MVSTQKVSATPLIRLLLTAGLVERDQIKELVAGHARQKSIVDVLFQEASLSSFRDLMTAEIKLPGVKGGAAELEKALHRSLVASGMINNRELEQLLSIHRPDPEKLINPLVLDKILDPKHAERLMQLASEEETSLYEALVERGASADRVCRWLENTEAHHVAVTALDITLQIFEYNKIISTEQSAKWGDLLDQNDPEAVKRQMAEQGLLEIERLRSLVGDGVELQRVELDELDIDPMLFGLFPQSMVRRQMFVPWFHDDSVIAIATSDPLNVSFAALLGWATDRRPQLSFAPGRILIDKINAFYGPVREQLPSPNAKAAQTPSESPEAIPHKMVEPAETTTRAQPRKQARKAAAPAKQVDFRGDNGRTTSTGPRIEADIITDNMSAVQLVSSIIESAVGLRATDIHVEPSKEKMNVRFRIDGELHRIMTIPQEMAQPLVSRVKVLADMDVTERRRPQDGHFELQVEERNFDFRISTLPAVLGEKIVIRILDTSQVMTGLDQLGLLPDQQEKMIKMLDRPHGMILVTGPTGSGKTSTLYAGLNRLNSESRNLVTIEDPVEYQLAGINQVQVNTDIGVTFAGGLRSILRQDPDVIMVGEVRDSDTANIAIRAAMTGHLVLSTLHTNSALGAFDALNQLGAQMFMAANAVAGIISQRLVRKLCDNCKKRRKFTDEQKAQLGVEDEETRKTIYRPQGCEECLNSGYRGRTGVFEVIVMNDELRRLVMEHGHSPELEAAVREQGMMGLHEAAVLKVLDGTTSVDEVAHKILLEM